MGEGRPALRSLRVRNFRLFMAGQGMSVAGTWMQNLAVGWLVLSLGGDGTELGLVTAARYLPLLLLGFWGGLMSDRLDKRRLLRVTATAEGCLAATLAALTLAHAIAVWSLALVILCAGVVDVFDIPARQSFVNSLVGLDRLANAIALNSVMVNMARIIGPGIGGLVIAVVGVGPCFLVNAVSYAAVFVSLQLIRPHELFATTREVRGRRQLRAGLRFVGRSPEILVPLLLVASAGALAWEFPVTLPLLFADTFHAGSVVYGGGLACLAAGAIGGGLLAARRVHVDSRKVALSAIVWGAVITAASAAPSVALAYLLLVGVGECAVTFNSISKTVLQLLAPDTMRGRVMSLWSIGWQGSTVVGAPLVGWIAAELGARYALTVGGVATALAGVAAYLVRRGGAPDRDAADLVEITATPVAVERE